MATTAFFEASRFLPSLRANNPKDARHGDGQYFSDIVPGTKRPGQLSYLFFNIPYQGRRFTHFVGVDLAGLQCLKGREFVYLVPNTEPLDMRDRLQNHGENR